jgi:molybdate transport system permease protein
MRPYPRWLLVPALLGGVFILLPLLVMVGQVDWAQFPALVTSPAALDALGLSLRTATAATLACVVFGVPMALVLGRARSRWAGALRPFVLLPLVLPPVVAGIALLATFGRRGPVGAGLEILGVQVAFSTTAVVIAQTFVALPFLVLSVEAAVRAAGTGYEQTAATLGAAPGLVLRRVTLPTLLPALGAGTILAFARALGEFGATITFAGSLQGVTRTLPLEVYLQRETDAQGAVALSLLLVIVAFAVIGLAAPRVVR